MSFASIKGSGMAIKTVHILEAELLRLRESSEQALQQSTGEMEILVKQLDVHTYNIKKLRCNIVEAREKEDYWQKRCLDKEFEIIRCDIKSFVNKLRTEYNIYPYSDFHQDYDGVSSIIMTLGEIIPPKSKIHQFDVIQDKLNITKIKKSIKEEDSTKNLVQTPRLALVFHQKEKNALDFLITTLIL